MRKRFILGCSALLLALPVVSTSADAHGRRHRCDCYDTRPYFPVYAPPTYTSLYYGTVRAYYPRRFVRYVRWRRR
jgi:hypothetical protein